MQQYLKKDRRREPRYETEFDVLVIISAKRYRGLMKSVSGSGMEIQVSREINPNTNLHVSLQFPREFMFCGKVVWTIGDYIGQEWVYRIGIKTESISYKNKKLTDPAEKKDLILRLLPSLRKANTPVKNVA